MLTRFGGLELAFGALLTAATVAACAGKALDVGSDEPQGTGGTAPNGPGSTGAGASSAASGADDTGSDQAGALTPEDLAAIQWPADTPCMASSSAKVGTWKGHWPERVGIEDVDAVLRIRGVTPEGVPCGTLAIGNGPAPPPVTNPDAIYPPSAGIGGGSSQGPGQSPIAVPWPGYEYRMLNVQASDSRLAFTITPQEILRPWCQRQTAVEGSRSCLPEWTSAQLATSNNSVCSIAGPNLPSMVVPCFKIQYCYVNTCFCYDGACDVSLSGQQTIIELHWDGPALEGSVNQGNLIFLDPVP